jgi:hypothetical protein
MQNLSRVEWPRQSHKVSHEMPEENIVECSFFVPVRRDVNLSDGKDHEPEMWDRLNAELYLRFGGRTIAPGVYSGAYRDPDTGLEVPDESVRYIIALPEGVLDQLRQLLIEVCDWFQQKCIYLSVAGKVEFISKP